MCQKNDLVTDDLNTIKNISDKETVNAIHLTLSKAFKMKKTVPLIIVFALFLFANCIAQWTLPPTWTNVSPDKVLVVYNTVDLDRNNNGTSDSQELAEYYQQKRNIPASNMLGIVAVDTTWAPYTFYGDITGWKNFWDNMLTPIKNKLASLGDTSIYYILLCDQMPYSFDLSDTITTNNGTRSVDQTLAVMNYIGTREVPQFPWYSDNNPFFESTPTKLGDKGQFNHLNNKLYGTDM